MEALKLMSRIGKVADLIQQLETFDYGKADFASVCLKSDDGQVAIGLTGKDLDDFSAETWQTFYPFLQQVIDEYKNALGSELDSLMAKLTGEPQEDAA